MPAMQGRRWTRADVEALIRDNPDQTPRFELVDGELFVTPSPGVLHQLAVGELLIALNAYVRRTRVGVAITSPSDVRLEPESYVQPDVYVVSYDEGKQIRKTNRSEALVLAVEVVSPGSARGDRGSKRELYQRYVPEYWVVDVDARLIERWRPGDERPLIALDKLEWRPAGATVPLVLELRPFFERVYGEDELAPE